MQPQPYHTRAGPGRGPGGCAPGKRAATALAVSALIFLASMPEAAAAPYNGTFIADQALEFGVVAGSLSSAGTVTINAATGGVTTGGGVTIFGGTAQRARFSGRSGGGTAGCVVLLTFPPSVNLTIGSHTATLTNFTTSPLSHLVPSGGASARDFTFHVGATLNIPAGLPPGAYFGDLTVTPIFETAC